MIVFIIAMESEAKPLLDRAAVKKSFTCCERKVYICKLGKVKCGLVICGVGKVNAAAATQYAIDTLGADKIINLGVAGGLSADMQVGAIYSVSHAVQYDFDLTELNGTKIGTLDEYGEPYIELATVNLFPQKRLATGDRFNDDKSDFKLLVKELGADVRDMEGGAIAHVCRHAGIPLYSFKAISDLAGKGSTPEQFKNNLELCKKSLYENIENIFAAVKDD